jgi:hypothetical protein
MKKIALFLIVLAGLFTFAACDKSTDDPANHYSYGGKDYIIDTTMMVENVIDGGTEAQFSYFQLAFIGINASDTTALFITVYDTLTNTLAGNYPAIELLDFENSSRGIIPFYSGIIFPPETIYYAGNSGSVDISSTDGNYTINFNNISVGNYNDTTSVYSETGKIGGLYKGKIPKTIQSGGAKKSISNNKFQKLNMNSLRN